MVNSNQILLFVNVVQQGSFSKQNHFGQSLWIKLSIVSFEWPEETIH
jgi:hypothetical protein